MIELMCSIPSTSFFSLIHAEMLPRHGPLSVGNLLLLLSLMYAVLLPVTSCSRACGRTSTSPMMPWAAVFGRHAAPWRTVPRRHGISRRPVDVGIVSSRRCRGRLRRCWRHASIACRWKRNVCCRPLPSSEWMSPCRQGVPATLRATGNHPQPRQSARGGPACRQHAAAGRLTRSDGQDGLLVTGSRPPPVGESALQEPTRAANAGMANPASIPKRDSKGWSERPPRSSGSYRRRHTSTGPKSVAHELRCFPRRH